MRMTLPLIAFATSLALSSAAYAADTSVPGTTNSTPGAASEDSSTPSTNGTVQNDADDSTSESAKMGKAEGTQTGEDNQGASESDTQKIEQPPRRNPTTGE